MMLSEKPHQAGFTLIELLTALAIVGIASAIGMPMLSQFVEGAAVSTQTDVMLDSLNFTRTEAVKRNTRVTMCRTTTGSDCTSTAAAGDWRGGWVIFVDDSTAGNTGVLDAGETVLRAQSAFSGGSKILSTGNVQDYVSYTSNGQSRFDNTTAHAGSFFFCSGSGKSKRRTITLTAGTGWIGTKVLDISPNCTSA